MDATKIQKIKAQNSHNLKLKIGILGTSLLLQAAGPNVAAIPLIAKSFPNESTTTVQSLFTIPSFSIMVFIILSTWFVKMFGKRNTVIIGLIMTLVGGILPCFINNFPLIVICRLLLGAGIGLYTPLAVSLIGESFSEEEQKKLLGIQSAMSTLGNSLLTFLAGLLLGVNWQVTFLVFLAALPIMAFFMVGYTKKLETQTGVTQASETNQESTQSQGKAKIPAIIYLVVLTLFLFFSALMVMSTASALTIQELNLSNQGWLSTALSIAGILGAVIMTGYSQVYKVLKHFTPVVMLIVGAIGFFVLSISPNMIVFFIGLLMVSSSSMLIPYVYGTIMDDVDDNSKNLVVSIAQVFNNLGAFASPYVIAFLRGMFNAKTSIQSMQISSAILVVIAVIYLFMAVSRGKKA